MDQQQTNSEFYYKELSYQIIGAAMRVHTKIGPGLPEYCYESALCVEFDEMEIPYIRQKRHSVYYKGKYCGVFVSDLIVNNQIILELKSDDRLLPHFYSQLFTYLRITKLKVGYLINFGVKSFKFKRLIL